MPLTIGGIGIERNRFGCVSIEGAFRIDFAGLGGNIDGGGHGTGPFVIGIGVLVCPLVLVVGVLAAVDDGSFLSFSITWITCLFTALVCIILLGAAYSPFPSPPPLE